MAHHPSTVRRGDELRPGDIVDCHPFGTPTIARLEWRYTTLGRCARLIPVAGDSITVFADDLYHILNHNQGETTS